MYTLGIVFLLIAAGVTVFRSSQTVHEASPVPESFLTVSPTPGSAPTTADLQDDALYARIRTSLERRTPADLLDVMTEKITFTRYGTACCGVVEKRQVVPQFAIFQNASGGWDFDSSIAATLRERKPDDFGGTYIGVADNGFVAAFDVTSTDLIDEIIVAEDYRTLLR
jgi:hypothetical protein